MTRQFGKRVSGIAALTAALMIGFYTGRATNGDRTLASTTAEAAVSSFHTCAAGLAPAAFKRTAHSLGAAERALDIEEAVEDCLTLSKIYGFSESQIACASGYLFAISPQNQAFYNNVQRRIGLREKSVLYTRPLRAPLVIGPSRCK